MYSFDLEPVPTVYRGTGMRKESVSELVKSVPLSPGSIFVLFYEFSTENLLCHMKPGKCSHELELCLTSF